MTGVGIVLRGGMAGAVLALGACASTPVSDSLPRGADAYSVVPPFSEAALTEEYRINPLDKLSVTVFQEPDLSFEELAVDASGSIALPLIGGLTARGRTVAELSQEIAQRLNSRYLVDAQVSVAVVESAAQQVTIEGNVVAPGIYPISGNSSLLQALALAKSPTQVARLDQVVIFRNIDGRRAGAVFDVNQIRAGEVPDPQIRGGDVVVVGYDGVRGAFRELLSAAPLFNVFRFF